MKRCNKCLLPETWPDISFGERDVCSFCRDQESEAAVLAQDRWECNRRALQADMERLIESCRGRGQYDVLVMLSGGKDSTYLLWYLKEHYRLRTLALTCDNGFLSPVARGNIEQTVKKIGVDHLWAKPPASLTTRVFRALLCRASDRHLPAVPTVCQICSSVTYLVALKSAAKMDIPLLAFGFSPAQKNFAPNYRTPAAEVQRVIECSQRNPDSLFGLRLTFDEAIYLEIPCADPEQIPTVILPFLALEYEISEIVRTVTEKGFINPGNENPLISNCLVNLLMIEFDLLRFGCCAYEGEFGALLRRGNLNREEYRALYDRISTEVDQGVFMKEQIDWVLDQIGVVKCDPPRYALVRKT